MVRGGGSLLSSSVRDLDPILHLEQGEGDVGNLRSL